ncbi:splicing regulator SDE2-like [Acipenser ruthenus]|uniref:splicing regulator SDE2-like n=1 Tax=Acipenser ruthenus TaxID=7906 RepID=UPI00145AAE10|nr:splicing regulator SDE2-like [Acipenser ruthenus]
MEVFVRDLTYKFQSFSLSNGALIGQLVHIFAEKQAIPKTDFYIKCNGRLTREDDTIRPGVVYSVEPRLCGGKGGFGSMLRALGAQIEKTTNREACRDLSGRRLRDVNHEKEMADWIKKQAERDAEKEQRRIERLQRKLAEPKHYFTDPNYEQQCHELSERLEDSVLKGMQASSSGVVVAEECLSRKRPIASKDLKSGKKKCFWTGVAGLEDSGSSDEDRLESDKEESPTTSRVSLGEIGSPTHKGKARAVSILNAEEAPASSSNCSSGSNSPHRSPVELVKEEAMVVTVQAQSDAELPGTSVYVEDEKKETQEEKETNEETQETSLKRLSDSQPGCVVLQSADNGPLDLMTFSSASEMEVLGLERIKTELMALGLKCGGTLQERAARLFSVRGKSRDQIDPAFFAKPVKGKKK